MLQLSNFLRLGETVMLGQLFRYGNPPPAEWLGLNQLDYVLYSLNSILRASTPTISSTVLLLLIHGIVHQSMYNLLMEWLS